MATVQKHIRVAADLYEECAEIFQRLGFNASVGIKIFFTYVLREGGIKFSDGSDLKNNYAATVSKSVRMSDTVYNEAKSILESQGYTLSQAVNLYFEVVRRIKKLPFDL